MSSLVEGVAILLSRFSICWGEVLPPPSCFLFLWELVSVGVPPLSANCCLNAAIMAALSSITCESCFCSFNINSSSSFATRARCNSSCSISISLSCSWISFNKWAFSSNATLVVSGIAVTSHSSVSSRDRLSLSSTALVLVLPLYNMGLISHSVGSWWTIFLESSKDTLFKALLVIDFNSHSLPPSPSSPESKAPPASNKVLTSARSSIFVTLTLSRANRKTLPAATARSKPPFFSLSSCTSESTSVIANSSPPSS